MQEPDHYYLITSTKNRDYFQSILESLEWSGTSMIPDIGEDMIVRKIVQKNPAVIIMEAGLPSLSSLSLCRRIRRNNLNPILVVTAPAWNKDMKLGHYSAGAEILHKEHTDPDEFKLQLVSMVKSRSLSMLGNGAQENRKHEEMLWRKYLDVENVLFLTLNRDGIITYINRKGSELIGWEKEELIGGDWFELCIPDRYRAKKRAEFRKILREQEHPGEQNEDLIITKSGITRWIVFYSSLRFDEKGQIQGIFCVGTDITQRRAAEQSLQLSELNYRSTLDALSDAIHVVDSDFRIQLMNPTFVNWLKEIGIPGEMTGKTILEAFPFLPPSILDEYREVFTSGKLKATEEITEVGNWSFTTETRKIPIFDSGKVVRVVTVIRNITKLRAAEQTVIESEEKFRVLAEKSPNMIFINRLGQVVYANEQCEITMGYSKEEFYSPQFDFLTLIVPEHKDLIRKNFRSHMQGEDVPPYDYVLVTKEGKRLDAIITTRLIRFENQLAILGIITDITERKRLEEQMKASLREKEILLRELNHRVKNNLQVITSLLRLQFLKIDDEGTRDMLRNSENRVLSMALVHEQLYNSTNVSQINFREYIRKLVPGLFTAYNAEEARINVRISIQSDVHLTLNKAIPLGLIVNELVSNILKHAFSHSSNEKPEIDITLVEKGGTHLQLTISDNGVGLPADYDVRGGQSLGLQLVVILAEEQLMGNIVFVSDNGLKTSFTFPRE